MNTTEKNFLKYLFKLECKKYSCFGNKKLPQCPKELNSICANQSKSNGIICIGEEAP